MSTLAQYTLDPRQSCTGQVTWYNEIVSQAAVLNSEERGAFDGWIAAIAKFDNASLAKSIRRPRRSTNPARDARAIEVLMTHRDRVLNVTQEFIMEQPMAAAPRRAMLAMLGQTRAVATICPCLPAFDVPAGVAELLTGEPAPALAASRVLCLYYMGISLFDDVIDHDLDADWSEFTPEQISCAALALVGALPFLALSHASASLPETGSWVRALNVLGQASSDMSAGQFLDIGGLRVDDTSTSACEKIVELKTGSTGALAAALTASMVGARSEEESRLANIGFNLYCAMQIASDIQDVWSKPISRDLANGIVTPPIAWFLERADAEPRAVFLSLFRARSESFADHQRMRALLEEGGSLRYALCRAELYRRRAIEMLNQSEKGDALLLGYMLDAARLGELPA